MTKQWIWIALLIPRLAEAGDPEALARKLDDSIDALVSVVAHAREREKPPLVFRLAELHWQKADHLRKREMLAHDTAYVAWVEAGQAGEPPRVESFTAESRAHQRTAVSLYRRALAGSTERADEIRFHLAYALYELGDKEEAIATYQELLRLAPDSRFGPQASLQLGEHWFAADELDRAEEAFARAMRGEHSVREQALYKLAWCDFNRNRYADGIEKLKRSNRREANEDLALFFARAGADAIEEAFAWFRERSPEQLIRMASLLDEQGQWSLAAAVKQRLLSERIGDSTSVRVGLMETLARLGRSEALIAEAERLDLSRATPELGDRVRALATEQHRAKNHAAAQSLYAAYLRRFGDPEVRYFYAGVLFDLGRFGDAAASYARAAARPGAYQAPAAHDAVLALEKLDRPDQLIAAVARYEALAPEDRDSLPRFLFRAAEETRRLGRVKEERALLHRIATRFPEDPVAEKSARLLLARLEEVNDWSLIARRAREFLGGGLARRPAFAKELARIAEGAGYKWIQSDEARVRRLAGAAKELGLAEVADAFARFAREQPRSQYADEALLSAVLAYSEIGRVDAALEASSLLAEQYGKSEHAARNLLLYAELHERIADFENAARIYDQFAHDHPNDERAADALKSAGVHYAAAGKSELARRAFERYASRYPRRADADRVRLDGCDLELEQKRWREAERCFERAPRDVRSLVGLAIAAGHRKRSSAKLFAAAVDRYARLAEQERTPKVRSAAARAAFELADLEAAAYRKTSSFVKKARLLDALICDGDACATRGAYVRVLDYGDPEYAVAALTRIADSYVGMAEAVRGAPLPRGLSEEQLEIYEAELQAQIVALTTRAIEAYELALSRGSELGVSGRWIAAANAGLVALAPERSAPTLLMLQPAGEPIDQLLESPVRTAEE